MSKPLIYTILRRRLLSNIAETFIKATERRSKAKSQEQAKNKSTISYSR
jgi:hypothetical protein